MLDGGVAFGDRDQARETAFTREQIVVRVELERLADHVSDREELGASRS